MIKGYYCIWFDLLQEVLFDRHGVW